VSVRGGSPTDVALNRRGAIAWITCTQAAAGHCSGFSVYARDSRPAAETRELPRGTGIEPWSGGGRVAVGRGYAHFNTCTPNCAAGQFRRTTAAVRLSNPAFCATTGHYAYRKLVAYARGYGRHTNTFGWLC